ncbi:MAG: SDR family oxidoreductase [Chloroflexi bacterium]|nr:SDR family oxidoreductase [Chloroflexota bacterium]
MASNNFSLEGKTAIITGGSRGIGRAIAHAFADAGADVAVTSRKLPELEEVAKEIQGKGRKALAIAAHIARLEDSKSLVESTMNEFGKIDILVNNAGTNPYYGPLMDAEEWAWDATMNVNLKGPFLLSQLVARIMKEKGGGAIINISSTAGLRAGALHIYGAAKAGLVMLTQNMAKEWGQYNIRVNAIAPGLIKTRISESLWKTPEAEGRAKQNTALGRLGEPDDIADVALFLASDASRFVTGETITADGGAGVGGPTLYPARKS